MAKKRNMLAFYMKLRNDTCMLGSSTANRVRGIQLAELTKEELAEYNRLENAKSLKRIKTKRALKNAKNLTGVTEDIWGDAKNIHGDASGIFGDITFIRGDVSRIEGGVSELHGDVSNIKGDVTGLRGNVSYLQGDVTFIEGNVSDIEGDATGLSGNVRELVKTTQFPGC